jgi:hypothetical protein
MIHPIDGRQTNVFFFLDQEWKQSNQ